MVWLLLENKSRSVGGKRKWTGPHFVSLQNGTLKVFKVSKLIPQASASSSPATKSTNATAAAITGHAATKPQSVKPRIEVDVLAEGCTVQRAYDVRGVGRRSLTLHFRKSKQRRPGPVPAALNNTAMKRMTLVAFSTADANLWLDELTRVCSRDGEGATKTHNVNKDDKKNSRSAATQGDGSDNNSEGNNNNNNDNNNNNNNNNNKINNSNNTDIKPNNNSSNLKSSNKNASIKSNNNSSNSNSLNNKYTNNEAIKLGKQHGEPTVLCEGIFVVSPIKKLQARHQQLSTHARIDNAPPLPIAPVPPSPHMRPSARSISSPASSGPVAVYTSAKPPISTQRVDASAKPPISLTQEDMPHATGKVSTVASDAIESNAQSEIKRGVKSDVKNDVQLRTNGMHSVIKEPLGKPPPTAAQPSANQTAASFDNQASEVGLLGGIRPDLKNDTTDEQREVKNVNENQVKNDVQSGKTRGEVHTVVQGANTEVAEPNELKKVTENEVKRVQSAEIEREVQYNVDIVIQETHAETGVNQISANTNNKATDGGQSVVKNMAENEAQDVHTVVRESHTKTTEAVVQEPQLENKAVRTGVQQPKSFNTRSSGSRRSSGPIVRRDDTNAISPGPIIPLSFGGMPVVRRCDSDDKIVRRTVSSGNSSAGGVSAAKKGVTKAWQLRYVRLLSDGRLQCFDTQELVAVDMLRAHVIAEQDPGASFEGTKYDVFPLFVTGATVTKGKTLRREDSSSYIGDGGTRDVFTGSNKRDRVWPQTPALAATVWANFPWISNKNKNGGERSKEQSATLGTYDKTSRDVLARRIKAYVDWYDSDHMGKQKQARECTKVVAKGWMHKKGPKAFSRWKPRYFVLLSTRELMYYANDVNGMAKGRIDLSDVQVHDIRKRDNVVGAPSKQVLEIITQKRSWLFNPCSDPNNSNTNSSTSRATISDWIAHLHNKDTLFELVHTNTAMSPSSAHGSASSNAQRFRGEVLRTLLATDDDDVGVGVQSSINETGVVDVVTAGALGGLANSENRKNESLEGVHLRGKKSDMVLKKMEKMSDNNAELNQGERRISDTEQEQQLPTPPQGPLVFNTLLPGYQNMAVVNDNSSNLLDALGNAHNRRHESSPASPKTPGGHSIYKLGNSAGNMLRNSHDSGLHGKLMPHMDLDDIGSSNRNILAGRLVAERTNWQCVSGNVPVQCLSLSPYSAKVLAESLTGTRNTPRRSILGEAAFTFDKEHTRKRTGGSKGRRKGSTKKPHLRKKSMSSGQFDAVRKEFVAPVPLGSAREIDASGGDAPKRMSMPSPRFSAGAGADID